jgi:hypothetical protein
MDSEQQRELDVLAEWARANLPAGYEILPPGQAAQPADEELPKRKSWFPRAGKGSSAEPPTREERAGLRDMAAATNTELDRLKETLALTSCRLADEQASNSGLRHKLMLMEGTRRALEAVLETFSARGGWHQSVLVHPDDFAAWQSAAEAVRPKPSGSVSAWRAEA